MLRGPFTRRYVVSGLGGAAAAWPLGARAQQHKMLRVGFVGMQSREAPHYANFLKRMAELGYQEGRNFTFDYIQTPDVKATTETIASSRGTTSTCSWRSGTSRRYARRSRLHRGGRSPFWRWILIRWQEVM